jgi:hypothetical protein
VPTLWPVLVHRNVAAPRAALPERWAAVHAYPDRTRSQLAIAATRASALAPASGRRRDDVARHGLQLGVNGKLLEVTSTALRASSRRPLRRRCTADCAVRSLLLAGSGEERGVVRAANSVQASVHRSGGGWNPALDHRHW